MKKSFWPLLLLMLSFSCSFSLTACGAATVEPILGVAGEPTLIFIYTDG